MDFHEKRLKSVLAGEIFGSPLYFFTSIASTNTLAFKFAGEGAPEGTVVIADHQTQGRGRMQREWVSPPAVNIYLSLILRPKLAPALCAPLTLMTGLAVAELLSVFCPQQVRLKWPNDVLVNNKKVCGVLTEIKTSGSRVDYVVIGIGININMLITDFPPSLETIATSLRRETGKVVDRVEVVVKLLQKIRIYYQSFLREGIQPFLDSWMSYSQLTGRVVQVTFGEAVYQGVVTGIDGSGALIIRDEAGKNQRVIAGDVKLVEG